MANHAISPSINGSSVHAAAVETGTRLVPAHIGGIECFISCPSWCVLDHVREDEAHLADVCHYGEQHTLTLPVPMLAPVSVRLAQWPNVIDDEDGGRVYLAVDTDSEINSYQRPAALALADQLVAFAADVRAIACTLPDEVTAV